MYDDILLPVAPESDADRAIAHAVTLARVSGGTVHVLSAADTAVTDAEEAHAGAFADRIESAAEERIEEISDGLETSGVVVERHAERGTPEDVILAAIDEYDVDVVVMPTHNREGLSRALLGSVTERVVRRSPVPVLSIPLDQ